MPRPLQYENRVHVDLCADLEILKRFKEKVGREHTSVSEKFNEWMREDLRIDENQKNVSGLSNPNNIQHNEHNKNININSLAKQLLLPKRIPEQRLQFLVDSIFDSIKQDRNDLNIINSNFAKVMRLIHLKLFLHERNDDPQPTDEEQSKLDSEVEKQFYEDGYSAVIANEGEK